MSSGEPSGRPRSDDERSVRPHDADDAPFGDPSSPAGAGPDDPDNDIRDLIRAKKLDAALTMLMKRHGDAVYRYCRESLRDAALAEDVQQRVFIEAHRDLSRYAARSTLRSWLFGIARHRVFDAAKARRRHEAPLDRKERPEVADSGPAVDEQIDDARLKEALRRCLGEAGEHVQSALLLRFQQSLTFDEMADVCGEKPGTLQARVSRALPVLRDCIQRRMRGSS